MQRAYAGHARSCSASRGRPSARSFAKDAKPRSLSAFRLRHGMPQATVEAIVSSDTRWWSVGPTEVATGRLAPF